jgi:hypothetical protein
VGIEDDGLFRAGGGQLTEYDGRLATPRFSIICRMASALRRTTPASAATFESLNRPRNSSMICCSWASRQARAARVASVAATGKPAARSATMHRSPMW